MEKAAPCSTFAIFFGNMREREREKGYTNVTLALVLAPSNVYLCRMQVQNFDRPKENLSSLSHTSWMKHLRQTLVRKCLWSHQPEPQEVCWIFFHWKWTIVLWTAGTRCIWVVNHNTTSMELIPQENAIRLINQTYNPLKLYLTVLWFALTWSYICIRMSCECFQTTSLF